MRVAVDRGPLTSGHKVRGIGVYTRNLLKALGKKVEGVDVGEADLSKYDLIHIPEFNPFLFSFPLGIVRHKFVVTVHDLTPLVFSGEYGLLVKGRLRYLVQRMIIRKARGIITDSETSKKDIVRFLGMSPDRVTSIYLAPSESYRELKTGKWEGETRRKFGLTRDFVVYTGSVNFNKNLLSLIKACKHAEVELVMVGGDAAKIEEMDVSHAEHKHLREVKQELKNSKNIKRLGYVQEKDLVRIYNLASVYVQPSLYEGFGLPVLEAMACGTPVIINKTNALVEVAGGAAEVVDAQDYKKLAERIKSVVGNKSLRGKLKKKGLKRVGEFSWEKAAKETWDAYKKALEE